jgi:uncharacterized repeat protein (TIGR01451 family)
MACDSLCDKLITIWSNNTTGPFDLFVDGVFHSTIPNQATVGPFCPGTYHLTLTNSSGCSYSDSTTIFVTSLTNVNFISQQPTCPSCNDGSLTAYVAASSIFNTFIWQWSNGVTTYFSDSSTISNLTAGVYCVIVDDSMGCFVTVCDTLFAGSGNSLIAGNVYLDLDTNGIKNGLEAGLNNFQVEVNPGGYTAWTSSSGYYYIAVPNGSYSVSLTMQPDWFLTSTPATYNITVNDTLLSGHDFGLLPDTTTPSADIIITAGIPRCNWNSYYTISYSNTGFMITDGEMVFTLDPQVTFNSATPPPNNISGNTYTWNFNNLYPFQPQNINIDVAMPATQGLVLNSSAIINLLDGSAIIFTDTTHKIQTVTCAYDPNDKLALPEGVGTQNIVPLNSIADYTIRFQNTGTDTAFVVIIMDTLSSLLDHSSFEVLAASHEVNTQMDHGGIVTFTFNNILLPDSNINEPGSHGFIRYKIKPLAPVTDPTVITNTAYIYFDLNPAIVTNTTSTTYSDNLLSVSELKGTGKIKAYPNPFSNEVLIEFEKNVTAHAELFDYLGRTLNKYQINNTSHFKVEKQDMQPGLYLLKITTGEGSTTLKLMVK